MTRAVWLGREVVGVPDGAKVYYPADDASTAVVAVPKWDVYILTSRGVIEAPAERADELLGAYFGEVNPTI